MIFIKNIQTGLYQKIILSLIFENQYFLRKFNNSNYNLSLLGVQRKPFLFFPPLRILRLQLAIHLNRLN